MQNLNFIEFLMDFGISDDILVTVLITDKKLLNFKLSQLGQILCVTLIFLRPVTNTGLSLFNHNFSPLATILMVRYVATEHFVGIKAVATVLHNTNA